MPGRRGVNNPMDVSHDNLTELESIDISSRTADSKGSHVSPLTSTGPDKIEIHECAFIGTFLAGERRFLLYFFSIFNTFKIPCHDIVNLRK